MCKTKKYILCILVIMLFCWLFAGMFHLLTLNEGWVFIKALKITAGLFAICMYMVFRDVHHSTS